MLENEPTYKKHLLRSCLIATLVYLGLAKFCIRRDFTEYCEPANGFDCVVVFVNGNIDDKVIDALYSYGVKLVALRCAGYNNVNGKNNEFVLGEITAYTKWIEIISDCNCVIKSKVNDILNKKR